MQAPFVPGAPGEVPLSATAQDSTKVATTYSRDEKRARVDEPFDCSAHWFSVLIPDDCFYRIAAYLVVDDLFAASHTSRAYAASLTPAVLPSLLEPQLPDVAATVATASTTGSWVNYPKGACEVDSGPWVAIGNLRLEFLCRKFPGCATLRLPVVCSKLSVDGVAAALRSLPSLTDLEVSTVMKGVTMTKMEVPGMRRTDAIPCIH